MEAGFRAKADETGGARLRAVAPFAAVALIAYPLVALDTNPVNLDDVALSLAIVGGRACGDALGRLVAAAPDCRDRRRLLRT